MVETIDTVALKAALTKLAAEDPQFLETLLHKSKAVLSKTPLNTKENPLLHQIVEEDFQEYEAVFRKLA